MTDEERRQNVPYHTAVTQTLFPSLCFVLLATLTFSLSSTWHIFSGFPVPGGLCYQDQARRKLQKWHRVIFHAGI